MDQEIKEKLEAIWPEVIGAVITKEGDRVNLAPVNYQAVSTVYEKPLSVCLGIDNKNHTLKTVLQTKEFVYAYPSREQLKQILYCGTVSGRDIDKLANTDFTFTKSEQIAPPTLNGAVLNYECKLIHHSNVGEFTIVIGEVVNIRTSDKGNLDKIYALGGMRYGAIKEMLVLQEGR
jgi:flavin reductase (DIM6/NTAB) family NADH-FMN oxidoreductase RutF